MPRCCDKAALLLVLLSAPWSPRAGPRLPSLAAGQGLNIPTELLGAGEAATLSQFQVFQDVLAGLSNNDGGRGSSKGGTSSGNTGAALATDPKSFSKLLQSLYRVAGAPAVYNSFNTSQTRGGRNYQPAVRDQGTCDTCVAQAIAAAMEASVASTLQQDASKLNVSAQMLYYCTQGWRSCKTGWDLRLALTQAVDEAPWIVRPTSCANATSFTDPNKESETSSWQPICDSTLAKDCPPAATGAEQADKRWLKCSYHALSTFAEIQAAIRTHGSVLTRMTVYRDFVSFFSASNNSQGFDSQPYRVTKGVRPLFGHAVIVTGYDNVGYTWTVQNSWGCSGAGCPSAAASARRPGVTRDGLFKIRMGDAGVCTPDQTFALACEPAPGSSDDLHSAQPWRVRGDMALHLLRPQDVNDLSQDACFSYQPKTGDTPAAIADALQLDIRQLARDNPSVFPIINGSLLIRSAMDAKQMADIMQEVNAEAPVNSSGAITPFFRCRTYNGPIIGRPKECRGADVGSFALCAGLSPCWLYFPQQDLAASIQSKELKICHISGTVPADRSEDRVVPYFEDAAARQGRALKALLQVIGVEREVPASLQEQCNTGSWLRNVPLYLGCNGGSQIASIFLMSRVSFARTSPDIDQLLTALLSFKDTLTSLILYVSEGEVPPQLGKLHNLQSLSINYDCMSGTLPPRLVGGLPQLSALTIARYEGARNDDASCWITGPVPDEWSRVHSSIRFLTLRGNRLSGTLPSFQNWRRLQSIDLSANTFAGPLPANWSRLQLTRINVSFNVLAGVFPYEWRRLSRLDSLYVNDNPGLRGCVALQENTTLFACDPPCFNISNTGIAGLCTGKRQEDRELAVLRKQLPMVFNPAAAPDPRVWNDTLNSLLAALKPRLRAIIPSGAESGDKWVPATARVGNQTISGELGISVAVINGSVHVTNVWAWGVAGIDMRFLANLVSALPQLQSFQCGSCRCTASLGKGACALPRDLAAKAPASLARLYLSSIAGLSGTLPSSWGAWTTLQSLDLYNTNITGPLPGTWANMALLQMLYLSSCGITGTLPASWGGGPMVQNLRSLFLSGNQLQGTIPSSWGGFKQAYISLTDNPMDWNNSCRPDGTSIYAGMNISLPDCSALNGSQAGTLTSIGGLLRAGSSQPDKLLPGWVNPGGTDIGKLPNYCTMWQGITCDGANNVVGLQLSRLPISINLDALAELTLKLPKLSTLELSRMNVSGDLSGPSVARLVMQVPLQHLNLSGNPGIVGALPELWAGSRLQTIDLSGCSISGSLPPTWAALQELQVLRLAATGGQGGRLQSTLPSDWGLLARLTELDISGHAGIMGQLPAAWPDAAAMQAVAAAAASAAADRAAKAEAALAAAAGRRGATTPGKEVAAAAAGSDSWSAAHQYEQVTAAVQEAAAAKHVLAILQAAAAGGSGDVTAASAGSSSLGMRQLQVLRLAGCGLAGGLPASFADLQQLRELDLSRNRGLGEQLPSEWGALSQLQSLRLASCSLSGSVPVTYVSLRELATLDLSRNHLNGTLPALPFAGLGKLAVVNLSGNVFEGHLPPLWYGMRSAEVIDVSRNKLSGAGFPSEWRFLVAPAGNAAGKLQQLRLSPGNPCMDVSNAVVVNASDGGCIVVVNVAAARAANEQGKCAVVHAREAGDARAP